MPTDDERRAVARRLRRSRSEWSGMGWRLWLGPKFCAVVLSDGNRDELEDAAHLLADLIEPESERTCRVECYPPGYEGNLHYEVCSECGTILTASRPGDSHSKRANYCPSCGALIIGEETGNDD